MSGLVYITAFLVVLFGAFKAAHYPLPPELTASVDGLAIVAAGILLAAVGAVAHGLRRLSESADALKAETLASRAEVERRLGDMASKFAAMDARSSTYEALARRATEALEIEAKNTEAGQRVAVEAAIARVTSGMQEADQKLVYRGREITLHADGAVTAPTAMGLRRFQSLGALDDYIMA